MLTIPGFTYPVREFYLEDVLEMTGHIIGRGSRCDGGCMYGVLQDTVRGMCMLHGENGKATGILGFSSIYNLRSVYMMYGFIRYARKGPKEDLWAGPGSERYNEQTRRSMAVVDENQV